MFLTSLLLAADSQPDMWVIASPLVWDDSHFGRITVPAGFRTDLASIPRTLRNLPFLDPDGLSRRPAAMHDWLYAERSLGKDFADKFLRASLLSEGASDATAAAFYYGVHWFGAAAWKSDDGSLGTRDFSTPEAYQAWVSSAARSSG